MKMRKAFFRNSSRRIEGVVFEPHGRRCFNHFRTLVPLYNLALSRLLLKDKILIIFASYNPHEVLDMNLGKSLIKSVKRMNNL